MTQRRLWPVVLALLALLGGAIGLELAAARHVVTAEVIEIHRNDDDAEDEDADVEAQRWYTAEPLDDDHRRARVLARRGDYDPALALLERLRTLHPDDPMLLAELGHWLRKAGQRERGLQLLEQAQALLPNNPTIALDRGLALSRLGRRAEAVTAIRSALSQRPNHAATAIALGMLLRQQDRNREALAVLEPAARRGSNEERARALAALGTVQAELGDWDRARASLREAVERAPASATIWSRAARALLRADDAQTLQSAVEHALAARKLAPQSDSICRLLGHAYEKLDKTQEALDAYASAVDLDPGNLSARKRILRLSLGIDDIRTARRQAQAVLRIAAERPESHFLAGLVEYRAGALEDARAHYERAVELSDAPYAEAHFNIGLLERRAGRSAEAIEAYRAALAARPNYREAWNNLGLVLQDQGQLEQAAEAYGHAIELSDRYTGARMNLGRCLEDMGDFARSIAAFEAILRYAPGNRSARLQLAVTQRKAGHPERAVEIYRELVREQPRYVRAWYNLGVALASLDRVAEARGAYIKALEHDPQHFASLKNLGLLESRTGQPEDARAHLADALERAPADDEVRIKLAEVHLGLGDYARCSDEAQRLLSQGARVDAARMLLSKCSRADGRREHVE